MIDILRAAQATLDPSLCADKSQHRCARAVRSFLERGGADTSNRPGLARQYIQYLPSLGYQLIGTLNTRKAQNSWTQNGAQIGDIAVYLKPSDPSAPGHICMWNGKQWCSDFRQKQMNVYSQDTVAYIYRYTGVVDHSNGPVGYTGLPSSRPVGYTGVPSSSQPTAIPDGPTLAGQCPSSVGMKGLWSRYQWWMAQKNRSPYIKFQ